MRKLFLAAAASALLAFAANAAPVGYVDSSGHEKTVSPATPLPTTLYDSVGNPVSYTNPTPVEIAGLSYTHISTNTTTAAIKSGAGYLHAVCVNTKGATGNTATVDDALTATTPTIAVIDTTAAPGCIIYDVAFNVGLTIVTATGTAADLTVSWR